MNNIFNLFVFVLFLLTFGYNSVAQITISNASFEGEPSDASMPAGWFAESQATTPDILPGYWGVYTEANEGETYLGLIIRADGSFESIGQRLEGTLQKSTCYKFGIDLAFSDNYSGFNKPIHLRIWISDAKGKRQQLIYKSKKISNLEWERHAVEFTPNKNSQYIILEAFINDEPTNYKGNILIDNITFVTICNRA